MLRTSNAQEKLVHDRGASDLFWYDGVELSRVEMREPSAFVGCRDFLFLEAILWW